MLLNAPTKSWNCAVDPVFAAVALADVAGELLAPADVTGELLAPGATVGALDDEHPVNINSPAVTSAR